MLKTIKRVYRRIRRLKNDAAFYVRYIRANEIVDIPYEEAWERLNAAAPMPKSTAVVQHHMGEKKYDLVIIVPAYNAERWIRQCVDSILSQKTGYRFLAMVIDDGSTDSTGEILDSYLPDPRLQVIHQENKGYSGARNVALQNLISEYIMFVDSDDYILPGTIELLMSKAKEQNADIVEGDGYRFHENGKIGPVKECSSVLWGGPCLKVIRSELFAFVEFPEGYLYEDTIICSLIEPMADKVLLLPDEVYAYRIHAGSISRKHDQNLKRVDSLWIMLLMEQDREKLGIMKKRQLREYLQHIVLTYRRTALLPEELKRLIFAIECAFIRNRYEQGADNDKLFQALQSGNYGKYAILCER